MVVVGSSSGVVAAAVPLLGRLGLLTGLGEQPLPALVAHAVVPLDDVLVLLAAGAQAPLEQAPARVAAQEPPAVAAVPALVELLAHGGPGFLFVVAGIMVIVNVQGRVVRPSRLRAPTSDDGMAGMYIHVCILGVCGCSVGTNIQAVLWASIADRPSRGQDANCLEGRRQATRLSSNVVFLRFDAPYRLMGSDLFFDLALAKRIRNEASLAV